MGRKRGNIIGKGQYNKGNSQGNKGKGHDVKYLPLKTLDSAKGKALESASNKREVSSKEIAEKYKAAGDHTAAYAGSYLIGKHLIAPLADHYTDQLNGVDSDIADRFASKVSEVTTSMVGTAVFYSSLGALSLLESVTPVKGKVAISMSASFIADVFVNELTTPYKLIVSAVNIGSNAATICGLSAIGLLKNVYVASATGISLGAGESVGKLAYTYVDKKTDGLVSDNVGIIYRNFDNKVEQSTGKNVTTLADEAYQMFDSKVLQLTSEEFIDSTVYSCGNKIGEAVADAVGYSYETFAGSYYGNKFLNIFNLDFPSDI